MLVVIYHYAFWSWQSPIYDFGIRRAIGVNVSYPELVHVSWWGWIGVEIFFVISGLVIALSAEGRTPHAFFRARLLRLAPALWTFATIALCVTWIYSPLPFQTTIALYAKSLVLFPKGPWIDGIYWSLTIELVFYCVMALVLHLGLMPRLPLIALVWGTISFAFWVACLLGEFALLPDSGAALLSHIRQAYASRVILLTTGPFFVFGLSLYFLFRNGLSIRAAVLAVMTFAACQIAIWFSATEIVASSGLALPTFAPGLIWLIAMSVIAVALHRASRSERSSRQPLRLSRTLGLASYPLYLIHYITGAWILGLLLHAGVDRFVALSTMITACVLASAAFATTAEPYIRSIISRLYDAAAAKLRSQAETA